MKWKTLSDSRSLYPKTIYALPYTICFLWFQHRCMLWARFSPDSRQPMKSRKPPTTILCNGFPKMTDLSKAQQSALIELYHAHTVLWDNCQTAYKDQHARNKALVIIQAAFQAQCGIRLESKFLTSRVSVSECVTEHFCNHHVSAVLRSSHCECAWRGGGRDHTVTAVDSPFLCACFSVGMPCVSVDSMQCDSVRIQHQSVSATCSYLCQRSHWLIRSRV